MEEIAKLSSEKEKLEEEMSRERTALQGLLENLQEQHHKVVQEKKDILLIRTMNYAHKILQLAGRGRVEEVLISEVCA